MAVCLIRCESFQFYCFTYKYCRTDNMLCGLVAISLAIWSLGLWPIVLSWHPLVVDLIERMIHQPQANYLHSQVIPKGSPLCQVWQWHINTAIRVASIKSYCITMTLYSMLRKVHHANWYWKFQFAIMHQQLYYIEIITNSLFILCIEIIILLNIWNTKYNIYITMYVFIYLLHRKRSYSYCNRYS